jgi:hypothetical protein
MSTQEQDGGRKTKLFLAMAIIEGNRSEGTLQWVLCDWSMESQMGLSCGNETIMDFATTDDADEQNKECAAST